MDFIKAYTREDVEKLIRKRSGEQKLGQTVRLTKRNWKDDLEASDARFVIVGVPEDIGVRANYGRGGANTAFKPALDSFLNQQNNHFLEGNDIFVLGEVDVKDIEDRSVGLDPKSKTGITELRELVADVDKRVSDTIRQIVGFNKIPIVIGGGHNNAFGNIKGASEALNKKINAINCDPHLDFRPLEGRHSGNGFSYAFDQGYLGNYSVFAMHEQYNNQTTLEYFQNFPDRLWYNTYESIFVREELETKQAMDQAIGFVKGEVCGLEIDLDAITNVPTSAKTSSGISPLQARQFIYRCAANLNCCYFHIAEGAPVFSHIKADNKTGKLISYLITDFIKGTYSKY